MAAAVYIGDEAHAAAWRLVGVDVRIADAGTDVAGLLKEHGSEAQLVLLSERIAARLPMTMLESARRALSPLLLVLPSTDTLDAGSELARSVRRQLGMEP
jgi:vacuolar-type H+-ATPase subunit F/Vma7